MAEQILGAAGLVALYALAKTCWKCQNGYLICNSEHRCYSCQKSGIFFKDTCGVQIGYCEECQRGRELAEAHQRRTQSDCSLF